MTAPGNASERPGAEGDVMHTPRRHRLTRRQSEQLLDGPPDGLQDGLLDGPPGTPRDLTGGPAALSRLLADARPRRATVELPGEAAALAAFRSAAVAHLDPRPRSSSVRTLPLRRSLAVKVLAVAAASLAVGGVSMAATGHLPGPLKAAPVASTSTRPNGPAAGATGDHGDGADHRSGDQDHPTGTPTGQPTHRQDQDHAVGLCRAWSDLTRNDASALTRSNRFQELVKSAGGAERVPGFCDQQTATWCEDHHWPGAAALQVDGAPVTMRCMKPTDRPSGRPTDLPTIRPTGPNNGGPGGPGKGGQPTHPGGGRPAPLPTGAPVGN